MTIEVSRQKSPCLCVCVWLLHPRPSFGSVVVMIMVVAQCCPTCAPNLGNDSSHYLITLTIAFFSSCIMAKGNRRNWGVYGQAIMVIMSFFEYRSLRELQHCNVNRRERAIVCDHPRSDESTLPPDSRHRAGCLASHCLAVVYSLIKQHTYIHTYISSYYSSCLCFLCALFAL